MSYAKELQKLLSSGQLQDALEYCNKMVIRHPELTYYRFWQKRLQESGLPKFQAIAPSSIKKVIDKGDSSINVNAAVQTALGRSFSGLDYRFPDIKAGADNETVLEAAKDELIRQLPFKGDIYLPTSKIPLGDQIAGLKRVKSLCSNDNRAVTRKRFEAVKEAIRASGRKRAFVIGNGPSLKKTDLHLLCNEVTIGFNGIFLHDFFVPTIYVVEDHLVAEDRFNEIHSYICPVKIFPAYVGYCIEPQENTVFLNHLPRKSYPIDTDFSDNAGHITYTGGTVTYTGLQIAASLGFEEIYLVGVDASYKVEMENVERSDNYGTGVLSSKSDDVNHFDPRYFGKGYRWHDPNVHTMLQAYRKVRDYAQKQGIVVANATIGGELEVFPRVDFYSLFERKAAYPKAAVLDFTHIRQLCATGIIKKNLFDLWPVSSLLNVHAERQDRLSAYQKIPHDCYAAGADNGCIWAAVRSIIEFDPDVLYLRPTHDRLPMTILQVVMATILGKPFVLHYMDDWIAKVERIHGKALSEAYHKLMRLLAARAHTVLAISEKMIDLLEEALGIPREKIEVVHNFIQNHPAAKRLPAALSSMGGDGAGVKVKVVRYFGGLEPDMSLGTVERVADAIERFNGSHADCRLVFEIYTGKNYHDKFGQVFESYPGTSLHPLFADYSDYLETLGTSALNLLCYNFDQKSEDYLRYSLANKLPEALGAGPPFLAIGGEGVGTIGYLKKKSYPFLVATPSTDEILACIERILVPQEADIEAYRVACEPIRADFSEEKNRSLFYSILRLATASQAQDLSEGEAADVVTTLMRIASLIDLNWGQFKDLDLLPGLMVEDNKLMMLEAIKHLRTHGITWSVKDWQKELAGLVKKQKNLDVCSPEQQARLLAFLVASLGDSRFANVNDSVRVWLRKRVSRYV